MKIIATKFSKQDVLATLRDKFYLGTDVSISQVEDEIYVFTDNDLLQGALLMIGNFYWKEIGALKIKGSS